jgi:hypothetical protein
MTAVDFERFVEHLADVSAEAILPFFRAAAPSIRSRRPIAAPKTRCAG